MCVVRRSFTHYKHNILILTKGILFLAAYEPLSDRKVRLTKVAALAAFAVGSILVCAKFWAWNRTQSVSFQATLIDSLLDCFASLGNILAIYYAHQPADKRYRFGYGKLEAISALMQSFFIFTSGLWLIYESILRLTHPQPIMNTDFGIYVIIFSTLITGVLILFQRYVVQKSKSLAIAADALHYKADFIINIAVLITLWVGKEIIWFDGVSGLMISLYIFSSCIQIFKQATRILMDQELDDNIRSRIREIILSHPQVLGLHEMRTRSSGKIEFIQAHVEMDPSLPLQDAHDIVEHIMECIWQEIPHADVLIHIDPPFEKFRQK